MVARNFLEATRSINYPLCSNPRETALLVLLLLTLVDSPNTVPEVITKSNLSKVYANDGLTFLTNTFMKQTVGSVRAVGLLGLRLLFGHESPKSVEEEAVVCMNSPDSILQQQALEYITFVPKEWSIPTFPSGQRTRKHDTFDPTYILSKICHSDLFRHSPRVENQLVLS